MMTSPKEEWRQQRSDYDILFIKGGWLVDKSNRPLLFVNQENKGEEGDPPHCITTKVKNTPWQIGLKLLQGEVQQNVGVSVSTFVKDLNKYTELEFWSFVRASELQPFNNYQF